MCVDHQTQDLHRNNWDCPLIFACVCNGFVWQVQETLRARLFEVLEPSIPKRVNSNVGFYIWMLNSVDFRMLSLNVRGLISKFEFSVH